ncbi:SprB repeat-containing protein, partial [Tenacibaculum maritimum]|uniref:SprB repeat-containing protein n=1 Tax=Tenacibaculum maritimum TaxID=107401 RepID=UPI003876DEFD
MIKKILTLIVFFQVFVSFSQELEKKEKIPLQGPILSQIIQESSSADKRADTPFRQRLATGGINVKGNMTFIGNNILNRDTDKTRPIRPLYKFNGTWYDLFYGSETANDPYNSDLFFNNGGRPDEVNNGNVYMDYIDVDGDASTFSSSKATLALPTCSRVVYAGLYWAGVYPYETWQNQEPRSIDKNKIKFKVPGGNYIDLIANTTDSSIREQIYDDGSVNQKPYVYYKDVTNLIDKDNPNGDYFAANIRGIRGIRSTGGGIGGAAGWALILIYENEAESSKNISLFDGFATIDGTNDVDVSYTGFTTIPALPVRAELIVATLEGDGFIEEDQFQIEDNNGNFIDVSNSKNPANNFFNGSITKYGNYAAGRNPSSENTLGFDVDLLTLNNPSNSVIGNGDTSANVRFTTSGDVYWSFLTAMSVEIIEPKIQLVKTIDDGAGNDVAGTPVGLGSELWYEVSFQNIGTDNALNTEIVDRLPKNVDLIEADLVLPDPRITYTYEAPTPANGFRGELRLKIPDDMVEEGGIKHSFRFKVKVVTDCNELRDVCSNKIENQAYANYDSDEGNTPRITNDLSFSGVDACNLGVIGTSNFLIDTSGCTFERDEILCGSSITLTAGAGFQSYEWKDPNGNVIGTNQTVTVSVPGTYTVSKIAPVGCIDTTEKINVIPYNNEPNPLLPFIDRMLTCPNDLSGLSNVAEIYLCGTGSSRAINLPFTGTTATTVEWFKLDETSCPDAVTGCANVNTACTWQSIGTSFSETIANEGEYRVDVLYDGRCPTSYYFNVFKATLNPDIVKKDIICGKQGSITVNNVPNGYEYKLTGPNGYSVGFQNGNSFTVSDIGDYNLEIRIQNSSAASCIYTYPSINIQNKNIDINLGQSTVLCATDPVDLRVQVSNAPGEYTYVLTEDGNTTPIATFGPTTDNDYTFQVTNAGDYTVQVSTPDCTGTESITINKPLPLTLTAANTKEITCKDGTSDGLITLIPGGGTITVGDTYKYAVWTDKGTDLYASIADIPSTAYFTNNVYNVVNGQEGIYRFIVVDSNNCYKVSNPIEIKVEPELTFTTKPKDVTCSGQADGQIEVSLNGGALGYLIEYKEENATTWNTSGVFTGLPANTYTIDVRASKNGYQCLYKIEGIEIKVPNPIVSSASKTKEYTCLENGEITFEEATGGTAPYSYGIQDGATGIMQYTPNRVKGGLTEGIYKLAVKDANNCTLTLADIVIDPLPIKPTFSTNVAYNCDGTGTVTITPAGAGYSYLLDGVAQADPMSNVFTNVAVGLHTIRVDYGSSCTVDISVRVLADKEFSAKVIGTTNSICNNSDNGTITVLAEDFVGGDFEYSIDGGATWSMAGDNPYKIVGLQDGVYNVFVKEGACEIDLGNITIEEPPKLVLSASIEEGASCSGTDTGATIKATAVGGTPPYTYSIDGGATWNTTGVFTNVPPSATEYEINVRDSRNCNECGCSIDPFINGGFEDPASSTSRPDIRFISEDNFPGWDTTASDNIIEVWSNGYNGVFASEGSSFVELNANRVSTLYQEYCTQPGDIISWSLDHRGRAGVDVADVRIGGSLTTATIVETMSDDKNAWGSYSGTYTVPAGQSVTLVSFEAVSTASGNNTIGNFIDNVNIQINKVSCVPIKIKVDPPATIIHDAKITECYDGSNGQIEVNVTQGGGNYQFRIDGGAWLAPTPSTATTYTFTGLTPKTYTVEVLDGLGCISAPSTHVLHPVLKASSVLTNVTCDPGEIAITGEGGDGNYVYAVVPVGDPTSGFVAGNTFPIAVAGDYDVYVRDNNGNAKYCEYKETVTIGAITSPKASLTAVQPNCTGNTGTINVFISEGAGPYEVTLTGVATGVTSTVGPSAATTASFTGLSSDTYEIEVKDANGCKSTKVSEVIAVPDPIVSSASKTKEYTCLENGEITFVQATGGTAPYSYGIQDGATGIMQYSSSRTKGGLTEGVYKLAVKDANNCILTLADITIDPLPVEPTFSTGIVYNCDGTGTITVTPTGAGYSYLLDGVAQADPASNVFTNVGVGLHTIRVDYGSSCTIDVSATVLANQEFTAKVDSSTDNSCNGSDDGTITLIASNYGASYEYSIDGGGTWATATTSPFVIDPVAEGTHAVQVRTTLGTTCVLPLGDVTISEPAPVVTSATIEQIADCRGTGATIQAVSTGGTPPYQYSIDGGATWNITGEFSNVVASVTPYTIQSKDSKGCVSVTNATITVTAPPGVVHDAEITECYDGNNGQIVVNVTQGNGNYQFRIDGGAWLAPTPSTATTYTFTGLTPKTYTVEVLDGLGCISAPSTHVLHPVLKASSVLTNVTCDPGEIAITGEGGDGNYVYAVVPVGDPTSGFAAGNTFPIAVAGDYDVYVRDNNGNAKYCEYKETVTIGAITSPKASLTAVQPNCTGNTGTINVFISEGAGPYEVTLTGVATGVTSTVGPSAATTASFTGLSSDTYEIEVKDANGCKSTKVSEVIAVPDPIVSSASKTKEYTCLENGEITFVQATGGTAPYSYGIQDGATGIMQYSSSLTKGGLTEGVYKLAVRDANNCILTLADITIDPLPVEPTFSTGIVYNCDGTGTITVTPTGAGYSYLLDGVAQADPASNVFTNVGVGPHTIRVDYGSSCTIDVSATVLANQEFTAKVDSSTDNSCNGSDDGTITLIASNYGASYEYSIDGGGTWATATTSPFVIDPVAEGTHAVQVRTTLGTTCVLPLGDVRISEPAPVVTSATIEQIADCRGTGATIQAVSTGGTPPYQYSIDGGATWNITGEFSNVVASVTPYTIQSKDSKGCVSVTNATITVTAPPGVVHDAEITECYDGNNGQIVVNVTQGNGNYQFRIDGGPWQTPTPSTATAYTFTGLGPKTYTVEVLDGLGCKSLPSTHSLDTEIAVSATKKELSCNPGEITVSGLGGDGNYVYTVVPVGDPATGFSTTTVYPISVVGDYDVYVRDNNGNIGYCEDVTTLTITQITNPKVSLSDNSPRCFGETGTVTVAIQNGLSPYKIEVVGALGYTNTVTSFTGTNKTYSGLVADAYTVTITDANGCIVTDTINLIQFPELNPTTLGVVPPGCVNYELDNSGFGFDFTNLPTVSAPYSIEYSKDNGTSWQVSPIFRSMNPGTEINPAIRIIDGTGTQVCINYLDRFETPFNVKGLIVNPVSGGGSCLSGFNVTVEAIGGVGPFEFAINAPTGWFAPDAAGPGDPDRTKTFSGLVPGRTYEFFVRDTSTGCIEQNTEDIYAIYTPSVGIEGVVDNMSCSGANSGKITFTLDNSSGDLSDPFDYTLYKRDPSNTGIAVPAYTGINQSGFAPIVVAGLSPGEYYLELTGATGCLWASKDILIEEGTPIQGSVVKANDITCSTAGVVNIENVIGGFGGYDYTLTVTNATGITSPTGGATSIPISYVNVTDPTQPVNVAVEVVDSNGCSQNIGNVDLVVSQLPVIDAIAVSTCDVNKTITVTGANGLAPYLYSIDNGVTYKRIGLFENLVVGTTYTIKIKDANGCESATQTRTIHPSLDFNATVVKNLDCTLTPNATIQLDVLSGTNNYSYIVETSAGANVIPVTTFTTAVTTFSISAVGDYKVTLTDVTSGCSKVKEFTVKDSIKPIFTYDKEDSVCNGSNSGIIRLTAQDNGIVPLRYTISPDPNGVGAITGDVFEKLPPATYVVTAEGSNGCTTTSGNIVIDELTAIDIPAGALKVTEFGCTTGNVTNSATISIDASLITGGSGTYKQVEFIDTKGTATTADDVSLQKGSSFSYTSTAESGGDYLITIYDDKGCSESIAASIAPFAKLLTTKVVVDKKIDCNTGEDITVTYTSSTPVLAPATVSYMVTGTKGYTATNTTGVFTGLVTDTYTVTVTNTGTNCVLTSSHQVLEEPKFVLDINKLSNVNCLGSNTGELSFEFSSSTPYVGNYDYEIFDQGGTLVRPKVLGVNGLVTVTGLSSGSYYVVATMVGSPFCPVQSATIEIEEPDAALNFTTSVKAVSCKDGANGIITVNPVGGWGSYQYELSDALGTTVIKAYNPTNIFKDLSPNTYTVRVKDINGCVVSKTETLVNPDEITFNLVKDDNVCTATSGGSITVTAVGGTGNYTYILVDGSGTEIRNQTTNVFASLGSGTYTVNVKDSNNCSAVSTQNITLHPNLEFTVTETKKIDCTVSPSGIVSVSILSGSGNYEYEVLNSLGGSVVARVAIVGTTVTFNTVAKDIYTINVYDVGATPNCSITKKIDIDDSIKPIFTYDKEDSVCNGSNSGIIR